MGSIMVIDFKTWEEKISTKSLHLNSTKKMRRLLLEFLDNLNLPNFHQHVLLSRVLFFLTKLPNPERSKLRHILTRLYSLSPLEQQPLHLEIYIFTAEKDLELLELSIHGAIQSCLNRIESITVVAPSIIESNVDEIVQKFDKELNLNFLSDEQLLARFGLEDFEFVRTNIQMEILKVLATLHSKSEAVLLIDGDTVILRKMNWITSQKQVVLVAQEYTPEYVSFDKKYLNLKKLSGLGFVTHHQVIRKSHVLELILEKNGLINFVNSFQSAASDFYSLSGFDFPSEWQLFGDFLLSRHPDKAVLAPFKNLGLSRRRISDFLENSERDASVEITRLTKAVPNTASLSFHAYKDQLPDV
jgi:hypothetical protein